MTDDAPVYPMIGTDFAGHGRSTTRSRNMFAATFWHTNTVEKLFLDLEARRSSAPFTTSGNSI